MSACVAEEPEPTFEIAPCVVHEQRHAWTWQREEDGGCSILRDGEVQITLDSLQEALGWLGERLKSGEVQP